MIGGIFFTFILVLYIIPKFLYFVLERRLNKSSNIFLIPKVLTKKLLGFEIKEFSISSTCFLILSPLGFINSLK